MLTACGCLWWSWVKKDEAAQLLTRAEGMARRTKANVTIKQIVASYAKLGRIAKARSLAGRITYVPWKADSLVEIARAGFRAGDANWV
jgi:hypothetical protein